MNLIDVNKHLATEDQCLDFLEKMRQKLGPMLFAQEFEGEFIDAESSAFSSEMIELALVDDFERFIQ